MSLTLPFRPLSNYAAANWPLAWKFKPHVCVLYSLLGIAFGLVLWLTTSAVLELDKQMSTGLQSSVGVLFVIILTMPIVVWIRATRHAPLLRSIPSDRFSPRFTFVMLGVIVIWGGFLVITDYVGVKAIYFPTIDQNAFVTSCSFIPYYIAVVAILSAWSSLGTTFMVFLVCLVIFIATQTLAKLGAGYVGVASDTLDELIKFSVDIRQPDCRSRLFFTWLSDETDQSGDPLLGRRRPGVQVSTRRQVGLHSRVAVSGRGHPRTPSRRICAYLLALAAIEIVCWLAGKVEALPER